MTIDLNNLKLELEGGAHDEELIDDSDLFDREKDFDFEDEDAFTTEYDFTVIDPTLSPNVTLATIKVRTIDRDLIAPGEFHVYMDNICEDFLQFSTAVYNNDGRIKKELVDRNSAKRGSGAWGSEINYGKLAYIESFRVNEGSQRQGVGRWAVEALLASKALADCPFFFTWATAIDTRSFFAEPEPNFESIFAAKKAGVIAFWRAQGFRRVGGTWFFGYARDPQHATRLLRVEDDGEETQVKGGSSYEVISTYQGW